MNEVTAKAYAMRFDKVFDYIDRHLGEPLTVEQLGRVANFSKFHFHRQFSLYVGLGVSAYVRTMRLRHASYRLVFHKQERIIDIAMDVGFENPESFSRAFRQAYGQSPSQFRKKPQWQPWTERFRLPARPRSEKMEVKIVDFAATKVALLEHRGSPDAVLDSAMKFIEWRKSSGLSPVKASRTFGIAWDDPEFTEPEKFRFDICGEISAEIPANP